MALQDPKKPFDWTEKMTGWLHPHIFEIGRTEAVHLASPSVRAPQKLDKKTLL